MRCGNCDCTSFVWANVGLPNALQCTDCGLIYGTPEKPWVEITKGQIEDCFKHSDNFDYAWAIEAICKKNNGY